MTTEDCRNHIKQNLEKVRNDLIAVHADNTKLIAVSKTFPSEYVRIAYEFKQYDFGENKVKDLLDKADELAGDEFKHLNWHFIGHLQTNKVKDLLKVPRLKSIHSIDSVKLINELHKYKDKVVTPIDLFLQINTSNENEKSGFDLADLRNITDALKLAKKYPDKFKLKGLMTIGKIRSDNYLKDAKICFHKLINLKKELDQEFNVSLELSFGMSQDYLEAVKLGSNYIRIGTSIFGSR
ncbi:MAG: YggS family pyridoxal phosphate-dependent enzyme [Bacteriovoracaceae bacterium]